MSNNVILVGPMGAGKTTLGKKLAKHLNRDFVDVDEAIQRQLGVTIQTIFDTEGEAGFRQRELVTLKSLLHDHKRTVIATGGGCVLTEKCRRLIMAERLVVHVDVGIIQQLKRLQYDKKRPILQGGNLKNKLETLHKERHPIYQLVADCRVSTDNMSFKQMIEQIKNELEK